MGMKDVLILEANYYIPSDELDKIRDTIIKQMTEDKVVILPPFLKVKGVQCPDDVKIVVRSGD